jgi:DNA-binding NtrC family response regulator
MALAEILKDEGFSVETAADAFKALPKVSDFAPDVVLTDLKMPGMDGLELMAKVHALDPDIAVIVMTAFGAVDTAVRAMKEGAADYLTKPIDASQLLLVLGRALERTALRRERKLLRERLEARFDFKNIVGHSAELQKVLKTLQQVAPSKVTVTITGESGTGKELVAAAIHQNSPRANGPFVKLHCASLAESLLESELFGHERGAFTGAERRREGRFEAAQGGTLFLDEIGEISGAIQVKLLRFLQEREFERVGSNQTIQADVRLITATNRDLKAMVAEGTFREDLFYRLNVVTVHIPSLRERRADIPTLATYFMQRFARDNAKEINSISDDALLALNHYSWPGNVRELENVMERAVVLANGDVINVNHLPAEIVAQRDAGIPRIPGSSLEELERYAILRTLEASGGSTSRAAEVLKISVRKIQYKLQEYNSTR